MIRFSDGYQTLELRSRFDPLPASERQPKSRSGKSSTRNESNGPPRATRGSNSNQNSHSATGADASTKPGAAKDQSPSAAGANAPTRASGLPAKRLSFADPLATTQFLRRLLPDPTALRSLRSELSRWGVYDVYRLDDHQVLDAITRLILEGRIELSRQVPHMAAPIAAPPTVFPKSNGSQAEAEPAAQPASRPKPSAPKPMPLPATPAGDEAGNEEELHQAFRIETPGLQFALESCLLVPLPGQERHPWLPVAQSLRSLADLPSHGLLIAGHTSVSGSGSFNDTLSQRRAQSLLYFLQDRRDEWIALANDQGRIGDVQALLHHLHRYHGWNCDPGPVDNASGPQTKTGLLHFQELFNETFGDSIAEDGKLGPQTWGALFDVQQDEWLMALEVNELAMDSLTFYQEAHPIEPCGERYPEHPQMPTAADPGDRRFVDLLLLPRADEIELGLGDPGSVIYDDYEIELIPVTTIPAPPDPPVDDRYQVWVRAFDHDTQHLLANESYKLSGPLPHRSIVREGAADANADVREQGLLCGDYELEIAGGKAIVACRWQVESVMEDEASNDHQDSWPDAVRIEDATDTGIPADHEHEPGYEIPAELMLTLDWLWPTEGVPEFEIEEVLDDEFLPDDEEVVTP